MKQSNGFTLIEVLIAAAVLACGLVAVASLFSFAIRTNASNREIAIATTLLYQKMEDFRALSFTDPLWTNTAGLETIVISGERFVREWSIGAAVPRSVTIVVSIEVSALTRHEMELIRSTTLVSPTF